MNARGIIALPLLAVTFLASGCASGSSGNALPSVSPIVATANPSTLAASPAVSATPIPKSDAKEMEWHVMCPAGANFCADFPFLTGSQDGFVLNQDQGSTSVGKANMYSSTVYPSSDRRGFCTSAIGTSCLDSPTFGFYFVDVFTSKYADPWTALTSVNQGVKNPHRISFQGNLAVSFDKGIYGGPGYVIWYRGKVYYAETDMLEYKNAAFTKRFLASIRLT